MSLTSFVSIAEVGREILRVSRIPSISLPPIRTPMGNPKKSAHMGTAIDYGIRFFLAAKYGARHYNSLIAELALQIPAGLTMSQKIVVMDIVHAGKTFLQNAQSVNDEYVYHCWQLANIDRIARAREIPEYIPDTPSRGEVLEFKQIMKGAILTWPAPEKYCLLNPTFGWGSGLVGGADADVVQDDSIIDIKTVKNVDLTSLTKQLVGYAVLDRVGGVDNMPKGSKISHVGVYYSRFQTFARWPIEEIISPDELNNLAKFFEDYVEKLAYEPIER